jgi:transcription factor TFIIIB component B''
MATLCSDTGQGRVSSKAAEILSNHAAWKTRNRERRVRMRAMMEAKKYGRTIDEELDQVDRPSNPPAEGEERSANNAVSSTNARTSGADEETGIDYSQHMQTSRFNVQVRIGPNGETIIDEDSLVVDRAENEDTSHYTHVIESDHTKFVNSGTYGKRYRGSRWSTEETELFYNVSQLAPRISGVSHQRCRLFHNMVKTMNL